MDVKTEIYDETIKIAPKAGKIFKIPFGCIFIDPEVNYRIESAPVDDPENKSCFAVYWNIDIRDDEVVIDLYNITDSDRIVYLSLFISGEYIDEDLDEITIDCSEDMIDEDDDLFSDLAFDDMCDSYECEPKDTHEKKPVIESIKARCKQAEDVFKNMLEEKDVIESMAAWSEIK